MVAPDLDDPVDLRMEIGKFQSPVRSLAQALLLPG